jgi:Holliday junction resolvase RusA-like endonuclease
VVRTHFRVDLLIAAMPTPRPRFRAIPVRGKTIVNTYYPKEYQEHVKHLKALLSEKLADHVCISTPVCVDIDVTLTKPKTTKLHAPKPDVDNYAKGILDALTQIGAWDDDTLVVELRVTKQWGAFDEIGITVGAAA